MTIAKLDHFAGSFASQTDAENYIGGHGWTKEHGWIYFDTTLNAIGIYDGTRWLYSNRQNYAGGSFPSPPVDGDLCYHTTKKMLFGYDGGRSQWLSVAREFIQFGRSALASNVQGFLGLDRFSFNPSNGLVMTRDGVITSVSIRTENVITRTIGVRVNNGDVIDASLVGVSWRTVDPTNQNFSLGDRISVFADSGVAGNDLVRCSALIEVAWR